MSQNKTIHLKNMSYNDNVQLKDFFYNMTPKQFLLHKKEFILKEYDKLLEEGCEQALRENYNERTLNSKHGQDCIQNAYKKAKSNLTAKEWSDVFWELHCEFNDNNLELTENDFMKFINNNIIN